MSEKLTLRDLYLSARGPFKIYEAKILKRTLLCQYQCTDKQILVLVNRIRQIIKTLFSSQRDTYLALPIPWPRTPGRPASTMELSERSQIRREIQRIGHLKTSIGQLIEHIAPGESYRGTLMIGNQQTMISSDGTESILPLRLE